MRRTFPFHDLSTDEFEDLSIAICTTVLGTGTFVFATGKDGGRDGAFSGIAKTFPSETLPLNGDFIIQAKHTSNPTASCSDNDFARVLALESPRIENLVAAGELDHYLLFTNRKKPANKGRELEKAIQALGAKSAHILGLEQMRLWLTLHPKIWSNLGFDRFETPLRLQVQDLTEVICSFHSALDSDKKLVSSGSITYLEKSRKNKINQLSQAYYDEITTRSLPYFKQITDFLKNPRNSHLREFYDDTADEIRRKILVADPPFESFDQALTAIIDTVTLDNPKLRGRRRYASIFAHFMYFNCDIGQHAETVKAPGSRSLRAKGGQRNTRRASPPPDNQL